MQIYIACQTVWLGIPFSSEMVQFGSGGPGRATSKAWCCMGSQSFTEQVHGSPWNCAGRIVRKDLEKPRRYCWIDSGDLSGSHDLSCNILRVYLNPFSNDKAARVLSAGARASTRTEHSSGPSGLFFAIAYFAGKYLIAGSEN